jgi:hypothetical protein
VVFFPLYCDLPATTLESRMSNRKNGGGAAAEMIHPAAASKQGLQTIKPRHEVWPDVIPESEWSVYQAALEAANTSGAPFLIGGGFALAFYVGRWRDTKDIDFYVLPGQRQLMIDVLSKEGFVDYYDQRAYDRGWIYRSTKNGIIVDIIWSMANRRASVDEIWFERALPVGIREQSFYAVPAEELLWCKLYVMQRDHSDWPDVINLLYAVGPELDWDHLLWRIDPDFLLLKSVLELFGWLCPSRAAEFPSHLRDKLHLSLTEPISKEEEAPRIRLLDSRAWFAAFQPKDRPLEI